MVCRECYGSYALSRARYFLEKEERVLASQRIHSLFPNSPFCDYNSHQSADTLVGDTIE